MTEFKSDALVNADFIIEPFRVLPETHRRAIAWYMAYDGDVWGDAVDFADGFEDASQLDAAFFERVDEMFGDTEFGYGTVATGNIVGLVRTDKPVVEMGEANFYGNILQHPQQKLNERYPVILSDWPSDDEDAATLTDGWTRFVTYVNYGYDLIPAVFSPSPHHYELLSKLRDEAAVCGP
jgi:hypothetical protein